MRALFLAIICLLWLSPAQAEEPRIALVIGNAGYAAVTPLDNARADAELIAAALEEVGFEVTLVTDSAQQEMKRAVAAFGAHLRAAGPEAVGLFYYAGHGVQSFGANYLLPVDARLTVAADLDLVGLEAASVLRQMASARNRTNIVILDACRDNPFEHLPDMNASGLAEMKAPTGSFLAYSTAPGEVALDGRAGNSPFSRALAREIQVSGAPLEQVFKRVRVAVLAETGGLQTPWDTSSLTANFVFRPEAAQSPEALAEAQLWASVKASEDPVQIMLFLRTFPEGAFLEEARQLLAETLEAELAAGSAAPADPVATMPARREPADAETALMERAWASGELADFEAYLAAYPAGIYAELVRLEVAALRGGGADPGAALPEQAPEAVPNPAEWEVLFDQPLAQGPPPLLGLTITEIIALAPAFPPIEGLPEAMWQDQPCSNCHEWNREALCEQGRFYRREAAVRSLEKQHPFGGAFKQNLWNWARGGCQ